MGTGDLTVNSPQVVALHQMNCESGKHGERCVKLFTEEKHPL